MGTSSIKCLAVGFGEPVVVSSAYAKEGPEGIAAALGDSFGQLGMHIELPQVGAVGLTGQVGSYMAASQANMHDTKLWLPWHAAGREKFLERALLDIGRKEFFEMTGMYQPKLASYPIPSILHIKSAYPGMPGDCHLLQPKDWVCGLLSGCFFSDAASWRGLTDWDSKKYVPELMKYAGIDENRLPVLQEWTRIDKNGASLTGLRAGTPISVGYSDFYSALFGMDIGEKGTCFDITGTSEHFGAVSNEPFDAPLIFGRYGEAGKYVHYGVTASSGRAINMARAYAPKQTQIQKKAPIFLPYVNGERAPVFDLGARGVFCGVSENCKPEDLSYSIYEGVAFSLYDIYQELGCPEIKNIKATGGASGIGILGMLKASVFGVPVIAEKLDCGSAMGAAKMAGGEWAREQTMWEPDPELSESLRYRFKVYRRMYKAWQDMTCGLDAQELFW